MRPSPRIPTVLALTACSVLLLGAECGTGDKPPDPDATTPTARGRVERVIEPHCGDSPVADALSLVLGWLGGDLEVERSCGSYAREIATGVKLGTPDVPEGTTPTWTELGGRGEVMADATVCMLADLHRAPSQSVTARSPEVWTAFGPVSVEQTVGYLDWDPVARRFDGYQNVAVCAPILGCLDATRQTIRAQVRESDPAYPAFLQSGDYPIVSSYSVGMRADESAFSFDATLPPITIITPYGPIDIRPALHYGTRLQTIDTPFDGSPTGEHAMFFDWMWTPLDDTYGRSGTVLISSIPGIHGGWSSQLGFGGRDGRPGADLWVRDPAQPRRWDLDLTLPRNAAERQAVVAFGASAEVKYEPLDILPAAFLSSPFDMTFFVSVTPRIDAHYASQLEVLSREGRRWSLDYGDHDTTRSEVFLAHGVTASAEAAVDVRVKLFIEVDLGLVSSTIVDIDETVTVDLGSGEPVHAFGRNAVATSSSRPASPATLDRVETLARADVDRTSFLDECLSYDPPPAAIPAPQHEPGSGEVLAPGLYPCNVCVHQRPARGDGVEVPNDVYTLFPFGTPSWTCRQNSNGCFDLCRFDAAAGQLVAIERHAPEIHGYYCAFDPPH